MFDMGFTEMMLIGIVALVVIGPERLPGVARTTGKYFTRLRRFTMNVRADVESELKADELREMLAQQQKELNSLKDVVSDVGKDLNLSEDLGVAEIKKSIEDAMPDLDTRLDSDPAPKAKAKPKKSVKLSSKKKLARHKTSLKIKAVPKSKVSSKVKPGPKKTKAAPKARVSPKKTKAAPKAGVSPKKTKAAPKARVAPKKSWLSPRAKTTARSPV